MFRELKKQQKMSFKDNIKGFKISMMRNIYEFTFINYRFTKSFY